MDPAYFSAIAALAGTAIGGFTSLATTRLTQTHQDRVKRLSEEIAARKDLYTQFINEASKLFADALVRNEAEISAFVSLYALISKMRLVSSVIVIEKAETVARAIADTYLSPNRTFVELRDLITSHQLLDPLRNFSEQCREELHNLSWR